MILLHNLDSVDAYIYNIKGITVDCSYCMNNLDVKEETMSLDVFIQLVKDIQEFDPLITVNITSYLDYLDATELFGCNITQESGVINVPRIASYSEINGSFSSITIVLKEQYDHTINLAYNDECKKTSLCNAASVYITDEGRIVNNKIIIEVCDDSPMIYLDLKVNNVEIYHVKLGSDGYEILHKTPIFFDFIEC